MAALLPALVACALLRACTAGSVAPPAGAFHADAFSGNLEQVQQASGWTPWASWA
jgi:hypothetical protein